MTTFGPFTGTLQSATGDRLVVDQQGVTLVPAPQPAPAPTFPPGANMVQIGTATYPLAAIDPTPVSHPSGFLQSGWNGRGRDELIIYTSRLNLNEWGAEAVVSGGTLGALVIRQAGGLPVPTSAFVLSGNGAAELFLASTAKGQPVQVLAVQKPAPTRRVLGVYVMDGVGHVGQVPPQCNRLLVAFYQGGGLVEWGGDSPAKAAADRTAWAAQDPTREILVSLGGQGGAVDLGGVAPGIAAIARTSPVHGIDFDAEAYSYSPSQAVSVCQATAAALGLTPAQFLVQFTPPGGPPVAAALAAARAVQAAGFPVTVAHQLYDTTITDGDVMSAVAEAVAAVGAPSVLVGMMIGDSYSSWTVDNCMTRMQAVLAKWPSIGGAVLWESSRPGTAEWAARVGAVLGLGG